MINNVKELADRVLSQNIFSDFENELTYIAVSYRVNNLSQHDEKVDNAMTLYYDFSKHSNLKSPEKLNDNLNAAFKKLFKQYQNVKFEGDYKNLPEYKDFKAAKNAISEDYKKDPSKYMPWDPMSG